MRISPRTTRIIAASGLALSFIGVSYVISGPSIFSKTNSANAESTQALLAAYATKDTDGDGLPDWQEALYGTDPNKAISNSYGIPDGEAAQKGLLTPTALKDQLPTDQATTTLTAEDLPGPSAAPGSITDEFSKEFLQEYFQESNGQPMTADAQQTLMQNLLQNFSAKAAKSLVSSYTLVSVHTSTSVTTSSYAGQVESILMAHDVPAADSHPLPLMETLIEQNDESARPKLVAISSAYRSIATDLLGLSVPPALAAQHLALIQSFDSLAKSTSLVTKYEKDPLGTLGALSSFQDSSKSLADAINVLAMVILQGGEPAPGQPGSLLIAIARSAQTQ